MISSGLRFSGLLVGSLYGRLALLPEWPGGLLLAFRPWLALSAVWRP